MVHERAGGGVKAAMNGLTKRSKVSSDDTKFDHVEGSKSSESSSMSTTDTSSAMISVRPVNGCCYKSDIVVVPESRSLQQASPRATTKQPLVKSHSNPVTKRKLFAVNKQSFQQCQVEESADHPLPTEVCKVTPGDVESGQATSGNGIIQKGSKQSFPQGVGSESGDAQEIAVKDSSTVASCVDQVIGTDSQQSASTNTHMICTRTNGTGSEISRSSKQILLIDTTGSDDFTEAPLSCVTPIGTSSVSSRRGSEQVCITDKRKKWQLKNREVSVSVGWSSSTSVTTAISGSLECLLDAVDTEMPSVRKERIKSLPRSPSLTALTSFDVLEESDTPTSSEYVDTPLCDPPPPPSGSHNLMTQSPSAAFLRRSCNDLIGDGSGGIHVSDLTAENRAGSGRESAMTSGDDEGEDRFESCGSASSIESTGESVHN
jgi:hypothetical protein